MRKPWKMTAYLLLTVALVLSAAACGNPAGSGSKASSENGSVGNQTNGGEDVQKRQINFYLTNPDMTDLIERQTETSYITENEKIERALKVLQKDGDSGETSLWKNVQINKVTVKDGAITLDIHVPDIARFGSTGENMALQAIQKTVLQFDEIKSLDILVDGKAIDSLMGHDELEHPIMKNKNERG